MLDNNLHMVAQALIDRMLAPYGTLNQWIEQEGGDSQGKAALYEAYRLLGYTCEAQLLLDTFNEAERKARAEEAYYEEVGVLDKAQLMQKVEELERQLQQQHDQLLIYERLLEDYKKQLADQKPGLPLSGTHVLVIGHHGQWQMYEEEIASRGGSGEFFPAVVDHTNIHLLSAAVGRADLVMYVATFTQHRVHDFLLKQVEEDKRIFLHCKGRTCFIRALEEYFKRV